MPIPRQNQYSVNTSKKTLEKQKLNFFHSALCHMKTRVSPEYLVNDCRYHLNLKALIFWNKPAFHKSNSKQEDFNSVFNSNSNLVELRCAVAIITTPSLHENCPYPERSWSVRIFPHSDWIRRESVFSTNAGNCGPRKTLNADTFHAVHNDT